MKNIKKMLFISSFLLVITIKSAYSAISVESATHSKKNSLISFMVLAALQKGNLDSYFLPWKSCIPRCFSSCFSGSESDDTYVFHPSETERNIPLKQIYQENILDEKLDKIKQLLTEHPNKQLILTFDLDDTLFQSNLKLPPLNLTYQQIIDIQQTWYSKLDCFIRANPRIILIYNTARPLLPDTLVEDPGKHIQAKTNGVHINALQNFNERKMMRILIGTKNEPRYLGLPIPHILISGTGTSIQFNFQVQPPLSSVSNTFPVNEVEVSQQLRDWSNSDFKHSFNVLNGSPNSVLPTNNFRYRYRENSSSASVVNITSSHRSSFLNHLVINDSALIVQPIDPPPPLSHSFNIHHATVNKGSALRIAISMLINHHSIKAKNIWLFIFGDSFSDITMIRPDREIEAISELSSIQESTNTERFGLYSQWLLSTKEIANIWVKSVFPSGQRDYMLSRSTGRTLESLYYKKLTDANLPGLPGLLREIGTALP